MSATDRGELKMDVGVEVELLADFRIVREVLSRIGIVNEQEKKVFPSVYVLHKRGRYFLCHFKELFALDGKPNNISPIDIQRRDSVARLLEKWELVEVIDDIPAEGVFVRVLPKSAINEYEIVHKYHIGNSGNYNKEASNAE